MIDNPDLPDTSAIAWPELTGQSISAFLGFSAPWLNKLEKMGFVERLPNKLFDGGAVCLGYINFLKNDARRSSKTEMGRRKEEAQARKLEIANAAALHQLVDMETVELTTAEIFALLSSEMRSLPAAVTRDLDLRKHIETYLEGAFERCGTRLRKAITDLKGGREPSGDGFGLTAEEEEA